MARELGWLAAQNKSLLLGIDGPGTHRRRSRNHGNLKSRRCRDVARRRGLSLFEFAPHRWPPSAACVVVKRAACAVGYGGDKAPLSDPAALAQPWPRSNCPNARSASCEKET